MEINQINFVIAFEIAKAKWLHLELVPWIPAPERQVLGGDISLLSSQHYRHQLLLQTQLSCVVTDF